MNRNTAPYTPKRAMSETDFLPPPPPAKKSCRELFREHIFNKKIITGAHHPKLVFQGPEPDTHMDTRGEVYRVVVKKYERFTVKRAEEILSMTERPEVFKSSKTVDDVFDMFMGMRIKRSTISHEISSILANNQWNYVTMTECRWAARGIEYEMRMFLRWAKHFSRFYDMLCSSMTCTDPTTKCVGRVVVVLQEKTDPSRALALNFATDELFDSACRLSVVADSVLCRGILPPEVKRVDVGLLYLRRGPDEGAVRILTQREIDEVKQDSKNFDWVPKELFGEVANGVKTEKPN